MYPFSFFFLQYTVQEVSKFQGVKFFTNCMTWKALKLVSAIFKQIFIFHQMIALQKL